MDPSATEEGAPAESPTLTRDLETCLVRGNLSGFTSLTPKDAQALEWVLPWREPVVVLHAGVDRLGQVSDALTMQWEPESRRVSWQQDPHVRVCEVVWTTTAQFVVRLRQQLVPELHAFTIPGEEALQSVTLRADDARYLPYFQPPR